MDLIKENLPKGPGPSCFNDQNFNFESWLLNLSNEELNELSINLNYLGIHFDPFSSNPSVKEKQIIKSLGLELFLDDPFQFTNIILKRLDEIETEQKRRNQ